MNNISIQLLFQHFQYLSFDRMGDPPMIHHLPQTLTVQGKNDKYAEMVALEIEHYF